MQGVCSYTDFFVVATGANTRQTKAIWDEVHARLKHEQELLPRSAAGESEATWIVADYLDVVLHVFTPEAREFYRLQELLGALPPGSPALPPPPGGAAPSAPRAP